MKEIVIGMPHRGRMNVLTQVMGKPYGALLPSIPGRVGIRKGWNAPATSNIIWAPRRTAGSTTNKFICRCPPNPSHLEAVDPVVVGKVRAKQDSTAIRRTCGSWCATAAAWRRRLRRAGLVAAAALSELKGYRTGGTIHFIVNNQIGFTTYPRYSRSSPYPSDVAKMIDAPIFHVNGDDPEAVVFAAKVPID